MSKKQLEELKKRFILPIKEHEIKERIKLCIDNGIQVVRKGDDVFVIFNKQIKRKKYWEEYALSTFKILSSYVQEASP